MSAVINEYLIGDTPIKRVNELCVLGITFDSKMSLYPYMSNITDHSLKMLGSFVIQDSFFFNQIKFFIVHWSLLEYCAVVLSPNYSYEKKIFEVVLSFCDMWPLKWSKFGEYHFAFIIHHLNLQTLDQRMLNSDICFLHNLISGNVNYPFMNKWMRYG